MPSQPGKYNLALRNDKVKQYNRFAIFIILLNLLVLLAVSYFSAESRIRVYAFFWFPYDRRHIDRYVFPCQTKTTYRKYLSSGRTVLFLFNVDAGW